MSLPAIAGDLGVSPNQGVWVITSFGVCNAIAVPLTGWLAQRFGQVRLFVASILLFVISSWLCGLAPNMTTLIGMRAVQGFVAGPLIPLTQALLLSSYPRAMAGMAMALWSVTTMVAPVCGPPLGGWITENFNWSWIFFINIPIGMLAAFMVWGIYHKRESVTHKLPIDSIGLALLVLWVGALQIMLDLGKDYDWFHSPLVVALGLTALIGLVFFIAWELTDDHPVIDLSLFTRRNFWSGTLATAVSYGVFFGNLVLLPLWLQQYMGYTATEAGLVLAPVGFLTVIVTPIVGRFIGRVDPRPVATFGFLVMALVLYMRSRFNTSADYWTIVIPTIVQGMAMSCFFIPLNLQAMSGLPPERIPSAAGLSNFLRITAGSFGASIATTLWESRAAQHHVQLAEAVNAASPAAAAAASGMSGAGLTPDQVVGQLNALATQQAFMLAANDIFFVSAVIMILLLPLIWITRRRRVAAVPGAVDAAAGAH